jgi:hypothetical protein
MLFKNNCCYTYSIVLLLHYFVSYVIYPYEIFRDSFYTLIKHKDFTPYTLSNSYIFKLPLCYLSRIWIPPKPRSYWCGAVITRTIVRVIHHVDQRTIWAMPSNINHSYQIQSPHSIVYMYWTIQLANVPFE